MQTNECRLCKQEPESKIYIFEKCNKSNQLWDNIVHWIKYKLSLHLILSDTSKILGYIQMDIYFWQINFILLVTRNYIYMLKEGLYYKFFPFTKKGQESV